MKKIVALLLICFTLLLSNICITNAATDTVDYSIFGINFKLPTYYQEIKELADDNKTVFITSDNKTMLFILEDDISLDRREFSNIKLLDSWYNAVGNPSYDISEIDMRKNAFEGLESLIYNERYVSDSNEEYYYTMVPIWKPVNGHTVYFYIIQDFNDVDMSLQYDFYDIIESISFNKTETIFSKSNDEVCEFLTGYAQMLIHNYSISLPNPSFYDQEFDKIIDTITYLVNH